MKWFHVQLTASIERFAPMERAPVPIDRSYIRPSMYLVVPRNEPTWREEALSKVKFMLG